MAQQVIAYIRDGAVYSPAGEQVSSHRAVAVVEQRVNDTPPREHRRSERHAVEPRRDPIDEIASSLASVAKLAQGLNETDRRRARDLVHALSAMLLATTYLPDDDQKRFQRALREA